MALSEKAQYAILQARYKVLDRSNPLLEDLPEWFDTYRPHQIRAINEVLSAFAEGNKVVVLDAPTGSGKTLIAETVRRMLRVAALYVCTTKTLQDQFLHDYDYARVLKGRGNYRTERFPRNRDISTADCTKRPGEESSCGWCSSVSNCPYERAKARALKSNLAVLNTSYLLTECNGPGRFSGRPFVIADECDTLERELMSYVSVEISERRMAKYGWQPPKKVTITESWGEWIAETLPKISFLQSQLPNRSNDVQVIREAKYLVNLSEKLRAIQAGLDDGVWVYTGKDRQVSFKPSMVDQLGESLLWRHGERWLIMSATVISAGELLDSLGCVGSYSTVTVQSTFPVPNRRVLVVPTWNGSKKVEADERPKLAAGLSKIIDNHPTERVLVHTVSYDLARYLRNELHNSRVVTYDSAGGRVTALEEFSRRPASVLLAPSLDRGIDLAGDSCRVQVVAKVPFPYLGDRQINARLHSKGGQTWYTVQAIRTIVQMTGRAVRSEEDWATTYILDEQFSRRLWSDGRRLFPKWWVEGLEWTR